MTTSPQTEPFLLPNRGILRLSGQDKAHFLQGLVTNDVYQVNPQRAVYSCLLTPQGRFLHDFFLVADADDWLIDCEYHRRQDLMDRLLRYKLRSSIMLIDESDRWFVAAADNAPDEKSIAVPDPRHAAMGWRLYSRQVIAENKTAWLHYEEQRIQAMVPDGSRDMAVEGMLVMECGLDKLHAIDFNKGCYLGQEMTARMFFRDLIKKQFYRVSGDGLLPPAGTPIMQGEKIVGEMRSHNGQIGLAQIRIDAVEKGENIYADTLPLRILV